MNAATGAGGLCGPCQGRRRLPAPLPDQVWNRGNGPKYHRIAQVVDAYHVVGRCGYRMDFSWLPEGFEPDAAERCGRCERKADT